jgi:hypothetical protein
MLMKKLNEQEMKLLEGLKPEQVPFVYMPCGCIGIKLHGDVYLSFVNCDSDGPGNALELRIREHNPPDVWGEREKARAFKPIELDRFIELVAVLRQLTIDASAWQNMEDLMNHAVRHTKRDILDHLKGEIMGALKDGVKAGLAKAEAAAPAPEATAPTP